MTYRKKLIEVALPLDAINKASAREKSIRHGHPSTLHLWWARRPLAACRAVLFASLIDDPDQPDVPEELLRQIDALPPPMIPDKAWNELNIVEQRRQRLFAFIEKLVQWENSNNEAILTTARALIHAATDGNPPPVYDPFCGGGSIPLEAQRLGLEAHASDLNPVAVLITKALIEIPPKFANQPPVNPESRSKALFGDWKGAQGLAEDVRYYGKWMRDEAFKRIGHLYPALTPRPPLPEGEGGKKVGRKKWEVSGALQERMKEVAREFRKQPTASEAILWEALRDRQLEGRKFRRQHPIGPFVVDFYCDAEQLVVEVDGPIHQEQQEADQKRQELLESLGLRFVRITSELVETNLPAAINTIRSTFLPSSTPPLSPRERGPGGEGSPTVIAWLWARTVRCPNPGCGAQMPLVRSFALSTKKGKETWVEPVIDRTQQPPAVRFEIKTGPGKPPDPPKVGRGATFRCLACNQVANEGHIKAEGMAGRMGAQMMAIVAEGKRSRVYLPATEEHEAIAASAKPTWKPENVLQGNPRYISPPPYGMVTFADLFTPRQLTALTTFSDLVSEVREKVIADAKEASLRCGEQSCSDSAKNAMAYADAVAMYSGIAVSKSADYWSNICIWRS
ncbi:DUF559 domain-containing protein [Gloeobacter morelensis]|uniref:DUF559 domain-containing protein n=1 Tax=Gloeobacter morelensis MG652769 TaxID=2781736 RepID=A0ABY3PJ35_9CYAN|nr:DUF559 domain-containing protein [Gloeobacter morelensis]UFP93638.1 DUF559 domain-containing protein [Gloeobacter morelensis MG652769]